jgi:hypothetical protein
MYIHHNNLNVMHGKVVHVLPMVMNLLHLLLVELIMLNMDIDYAVKNLQIGEWTGIQHTYELLLLNTVD